MTQEQQQVIDKTAQALRETVAAIEAKPATTRHHYAEYMTLLSDLNRYKHATRFWALVLIHAGANAQGVEDAARLI